MESCCCRAVSGCGPVWQGFWNSDKGEAVCPCGEGYDEMLTLQCRDPAGSTGGPCYSMREDSADHLWFLCVFYWSFKTEEFVLGKILYVPELSSPKRPFLKQLGLLTVVNCRWLYMFTVHGFYCFPQQRKYFYICFTIFFKKIVNIS